MDNHGMEYNSQRDNLIIAEYGRHVQGLIEYVKTIEDDAKRQEYAESVVSLMGQMNPAHRNDEEYKEKLWRHLFRIANYDINVTPQSGVVPTPESSEYSPSVIPYPKNQKRYRHYGSHVQNLIEKAKGMEDPEKKDELIILIASYMKIAYRTWNSQHYASDDIIKADLKAMSDGALVMDEEATIDVGHIRTASPRRNQNNKGRRNNGGSHSNNRNRNNFSRNNNNKGQRKRR